MLLKLKQKKRVNHTLREKFERAKVTRLQGLLQSFMDSLFLKGQLSAAQERPEEM